MAAIELDEKRGALRDVAVGKGQLATVRMLQKNYGEALELHQEAKSIFEQYREPRHVAVAWHQIGMVHQHVGNYTAAEKAYQESLAIKIRENNKQGEAASLGQLGRLYDDMDRLEDAVRMYERVADLYTTLGNLEGEGRLRNNMAISLMKLNRMPEARTQLLRAIECKSQLGHAAEPWTTWAILCELEKAEGNYQSAAEARLKAMQAYAAYRKDGGESQANQYNFLLATAQALEAGEQEKLIQYLQSTLEPNDPLTYTSLINTLIAILRGIHDPALVEDPELYYMDAVDLKLLFFNGAGL